MRLHLTASVFWVIALVCQASLYGGSVLWESEAVQVLEEDGLLRVSPKKKVCHIDELPEATFVAMEKTLGKLESVFEEVFGRGDFVRWMPFHDNSGIQVKVVPTLAYQEKDVIDLGVKVRILLDQFCDKERHLPGLSEETLSKISVVAKKILSEDSYPAPTPSPRGTFLYRNIPESCELLAQALKEMGDEIFQGLDTEKRSFSSFTPGQCNLCRQEVQQNQSIYQSKINHVLINLKPYSKTNRSFMVIPNHHMSKIAEQTEDDIIDFFYLVLKLDHINTHYLNELENSHEQGMIITRNGWFAGQTEPHLHHHIVFFIPNTPQRWMRDLLFSLSGYGTKGEKVKQEEYDQLRKELSPLFL